MVSGWNRRPRLEGQSAAGLIDTDPPLRCSALLSVCLASYRLTRVGSMWDELDALSLTTN